MARRASGLGGAPILILPFAAIGRSVHHSQSWQNHAIDLMKRLCFVLGAMATPEWPLPAWSQLSAGYARRAVHSISEETYDPVNAGARSGRACAAGADHRGAAGNRAR